MKLSDLPVWVREELSKLPDRLRYSPVILRAIENLDHWPAGSKMEVKHEVV